MQEFLVLKVAVFPMGSLLQAEVYRKSMKPEFRAIDRNNFIVPVWMT